MNIFIYVYIFKFCQCGEIFISNLILFFTVWILALKKSLRSASRMYVIFQSIDQKSVGVIGKLLLLFIFSLWICGLGDYPSLQDKREW